jgi:glutamyl-tRNA synthetase/glutamyl-Q tRNA(Asp) synthetase
MRDDWRTTLLGRIPRGSVTRFAPAPTGYLHLGHAANALAVWGIARATGSTVLLRIEDHDRGRCRPEYEAALRDDLAWLGFTPDREVPSQRERGERYAAALASLAVRAYVCDCSRRDIAQQVGEVFGEEMRYPGTCRDRALSPAASDARRIPLGDTVEHFDDLRLGAQEQRPAQQCGDLLVRDRAGHWTYQFAVTVDDLDQGVDLIVRGEDLLASTGRQFALARLLGRAEPPRVVHHALLRHPDGSKLSKSDGATGIRELRASGWSAAKVLGRAAQLAGLKGDAGPIAASEAARLFSA